MTKETLLKQYRSLESIMGDLPCEVRRISHKGDAGFEVECLRFTDLQDLHRKIRELPACKIVCSREGYMTIAFIEGVDPLEVRERKDTKVGPIG